MSDSKNEIEMELQRHLERTNSFFDRCSAALAEILRQHSWEMRTDYFWSRLPNELRTEGEELVGDLVAIGQRAYSLCKNSALVNDADTREISFLARQMRGAIHLSQYEYFAPRAVYDDGGSIIGLQPPSQSDGVSQRPDDAKDCCSRAYGRLFGILQLADSQGSASPNMSEPMGILSRYRPNSAFVMMWMDPAQKDLEDVRDTVLATFDRFAIRALRADDIEHEGVVTQRILDEIRTSEFLFADLTGARPSVYYEVGYAHALGKRVILFRKKGTSLHFDLAGYNCPEYENLRELREKLTRRLESVTNKQAQPDPSSTPPISESRHASVH